MGRSIYMPRCDACVTDVMRDEMRERWCPPQIQRCK
jgi:hypothetical protein